jgi:predicted kinase
MSAMLILIRGLPGSGKSTLAETYSRAIGASWYEADMWFVGADHVYRFDETKLRYAHEACHSRTETDLRAGERVIVSNTFTRLWELAAYFTLAKELEVPEPTVITMHGQFRNVHNVPEDKIAAMKTRWEHFDIDKVRAMRDCNV